MQKHHHITHTGEKEYLVLEIPHRLEIRTFHCI